MIKTTYAKLMQEQATFRALEAQLSAQKKVIDELREEMIVEMQDAGTDSYKSNLGSISLLKSVVPTVTDWNLLYGYIHENDAFDLLQRRVTATAWRDRVEEIEQPIPGVESFEKSTLRINLAK